MQGFYNEKYWVQKAMKEHAGGFVSNMGAALEHATPENALLIKQTWPNFWDEYLAININQCFSKIKTIIDIFIGGMFCKFIGVI